MIGNIHLSNATIENFSGNLFWIKPFYLSMSANLYCNVNIDEISIKNGTG
jgi:hypothetical protein